MGHSAVGAAELEKAVASGQVRPVVNVKRLRETLGLTQEELAARAGLTPNAISALERGEHHHPYPATVRGLADALGLATEEHAALAASVPKRRKSRGGFTIVASGSNGTRRARSAGTR